MLNLCDDILYMLVNLNPYCYTRLSLTCKKLASLRNFKCRELWKKKVKTENEEYYILPSKLKEGDYFKYYFQGEIHIRASYLQGQLHGGYVVYYPNGKVKKLYNFKKDQLNGVCFAWDIEGNLEMEAHFLNDVHHGPLILWNKGKIYEKSNYYYGKLHGEYIKFEGRTFIFSNYRYGKIHGSFERYTTENEYYFSQYKNGKKHGKCIRSEYNIFESSCYKDNKLHGNYIRYNFDTPRYTMVGKFNNNRRDGEWILSNDASVIERKLYKDGRLVKIVKDGKVFKRKPAERILGGIIRYDRKNNKKKFIADNLKFFEFYSNGSIKKSGKYIVKNNHLLVDGTLKHFYKDGTLKCFTEYYEGQRHGKFFEFSKKGYLVKFQEYRYGRVEGAIFQLYPFISGTFSSISPYRLFTENSEFIIYEDEKKLIEFDKNQQEFTKILFKNGKVFGYYTYGVLKFTCSVKNGKFHGIYKEYYNNGQMRLLCCYNNGKVVGVRKTWNLYGEMDFF